MSSEHYTESNHAEWSAAGLKSYGDFAECVEYVNQREDYCDSLRGGWFYADDDTRTIYSGSFGNDHSPGASHYTYAEVYDDETEYRADVSKWNAKPEYLDTDDDETDEDEDSESDETDNDQ